MPHIDFEEETKTKWANMKILTPNYVNDFVYRNKIYILLRI